MQEDGGSRIGRGGKGGLRVRGEWIGTDGSGRNVRDDQTRRTTGDGRVGGPGGKELGGKGGKEGADRERHLLCLLP